MIQEGNIHVDYSSDDGITILIIASSQGCLEIVEFLISEGADVEAVGLNGVSSLMAAAANDHDQVIETLVVKGHADINGNKHKFAATSPLHYAAELGAVNALKKLCELGGNIYSKTTIDSSPLHTAAHVGVEDQKGKNGTIDAIVNHCKFDVNTLMNNDTTALYIASQFGFVQTVSALLDVGADVNFFMPIAKYNGDKFIATRNELDYNAVGVNSETANGASAIHVASEEGHATVVQTLIKFGADMNSKTIGVTPLILATQYNRSSVVRVLIENGADIDDVSLLDGSTAIYCASGKGLIQIMDQLLSAGADPVKKSTSTGFPLLYAALSGQYESVKMLLKYNTDVNMHSNSRITALLAAASRADVDIIKLLLREGANPFATTDEGFNLFHLLTLSKSSFKVKIMRKLIKFQHKLTSLLYDTDKDGNNLLHYATSKQDLKLIQFLIEQEVDINMKNHEGEFPLYIASSLGNSNIVAALLKVESCDANAVVDALGITPLLAAIDKNHVKTVLVLLKRNSTAAVSIEGEIMGSATVNVVDVNKGSKEAMQSPLLYAVIKNRSEIAKILLGNIVFNLRLLHYFNSILRNQY
jgi:ankyrin repeat protein